MLQPLKIMQLSKIKCIVNFNRLYDRYTKLMTVVDNKNTHIFIGGSFKLINTETNESVSMTIAYEDTDSYLMSFATLNGGIVYMQTIWDEHHIKVLDVIRYSIEYSKDTTFYFGITY